MSNPYYDQWLEETKKRLIAEYDRLKFRASGSYAEALEPFYQVRGSKEILGMLGARHSEYMTRGRGATSPAKRGRLWGIIQQWIKDKNITPRDPKMTTKTLAWLIARKIDLQGYSVADRTGVVDNVLTDEWINELFKRVNQIQATIIVKDLQELLKNG